MLRPTLRAALLAGAMAVAIALPGITPAQAAGQLLLYTWTDYTSPDLIKKFEAETGIKVTVDTYDSNETVLAKLKSGAAGYDVVVISSDFVSIFAHEGLIERVEASKMPGYDAIAPRWRDPAWDPHRDYSVPFQWGVTSFAVNTKDVKGPYDSLKLLFEPPASDKGKVGMMGSPSEVVSLAEVYLGLPPCQTDAAGMKKVSDLLDRQKPDVKVYNSDGIIDRLSSGETWIHEVWNGDAARARINNPDIRFVFPKEGVTGWMDSLAIPKGAKDPDAARAFMAFMLKPENSAISSNFTHYASGLSATPALYDDAMKASPELQVPEDEKIVFTPACPAAATKLVDRVWTRLKK